MLTNTYPTLMARRVYELPMQLCVKWREGMNRHQVAYPAGTTGRVNEAEPAVGWTLFNRLKLSWNSFVLKSWRVKTGSVGWKFQLMFTGLLLFHSTGSCRSRALEKGARAARRLGEPVGHRLADSVGQTTHQR